MEAEAGIRSLGFVPREDLPLIYSLASMFVYPSFYEGFGLPVLEAMASGCPVVTSNRGSLKEICQDNALFVEPDAEDDLFRQMTRLSVDKVLREDFVKKGRKNALRFTWKKSAEKILELYQELR